VRIEIATSETLVEVYDLDVPITASDRDLLDAAATIAPVRADRRRNGEPFVLSRELVEVEAIADAMALGRQAEESAKAFVLTPESEAISEYDLAEKFGVDRSTIRRWRGKGRAA
jgi:hypothetical protein